jgi:hypothetical protein
MTWEVERHNLSTGERWTVAVEAKSRGDAMHKVMRRKEWAADLASGYLFSFRVDFFQGYPPDIQDSD